MLPNSTFFKLFYFLAKLPTTSSTPIRKGTSVYSDQTLRRHSNSAYASVCHVIASTSAVDSNHLMTSSSAIVYPVKPLASVNSSFEGQDLIDRVHYVEPIYLNIYPG